MKQVVCLGAGVYHHALTRGKHYSVLAHDEQKRQIRIKGDNGKTRWFPTYSFGDTSVAVPTLSAYEIDDEFTAGAGQVVEVTVQLTDGQTCRFATPAALANFGNEIQGIQTRFHYCNRDLIVADELSEDLIGRMLRHIDNQGDLIECTLPLGESDDEVESV